MPIDADLVRLRDVQDDQEFQLPGRKGPSIAWLYERINEGKLRKWTIMGQTYISRSELRQLLFPDPRATSTSDVPPPPNT